VCKFGETHPGWATVTVTRGETVLVIKDVPADVCDNCGEEYVDADTTRRLEQTTRAAIESGVQIEVRKFITA
jgi:YgiT-type zinc finger domain-containing protein